MDIDGDGVLDLVFSQSGKVAGYYKGKINSNGQFSFSDDGKFREVSGLVAVNSEPVNQTSGMSVEVHPPGGFVGYSRNSSSAMQNIYPADINADRCIDIVRNGTVYFNNCNDISKEDPDKTYDFGTKFEDDLYLDFNSAPNITSDAVIKTALTSLADNLPKPKAQNNLDIARTWRAPFTGTVSILGDAELIGKDHDDHDGVFVSIERNSERTLNGSNGTNEICWKQSLDWKDGSNKSSFAGSPTCSNAVFSANNLEMDVTAGDIIFFRAHSKVNAIQDEVKWAPSIKFIRIENYKEIFSSTTDYENIVTQIPHNPSSKCVTEERSNGLCDPWDKSYVRFVATANNSAFLVASGEFIIPQGSTFDVQNKISFPTSYLTHELFYQRKGFEEACDEGVPIPFDKDTLASQTGDKLCFYIFSLNPNDIAAGVEPASIYPAPVDYTNFNGHIEVKITPPNSCNGSIFSEPPPPGTEIEPTDCTEPLPPISEDKKLVYKLYPNTPGFHQLTSFDSHGDKALLGETVVSKIRIASTVTPIPDADKCLYKDESGNELTGRLTRHAIKADFLENTFNGTDGNELNLLFKTASKDLLLPGFEYKKIDGSQINPAIDLKPELDLESPAYLKQDPVFAQKFKFSSKAAGRLKTAELIFSQTKLPVEDGAMAICAPDDAIELEVIAFLAKPVKKVGGDTVDLCTGNEGACPLSSFQILSLDNSTDLGVFLPTDFRAESDSYRGWSVLVPSIAKSAGSLDDFHSLQTFNELVAKPEFGAISLGNIQSEIKDSAPGENEEFEDKDDNSPKSLLGDKDPLSKILAFRTFAKVEIKKDSFCGLSSPGGTPSDELYRLGPDQTAWQCADRLNPSRLGPKNPGKNPISQHLTQLSDETAVSSNRAMWNNRGLPKVSEGNSNVWVTGIGPAGGTVSRGVTKSEIELIDMNLDGFPDQIIGGKIIYTDFGGAFACQSGRPFQGLPGDQYCKDNSLSSQLFVDAPINRRTKTNSQGVSLSAKSFFHSVGSANGGRNGSTRAIPVAESTTSADPKYGNPDLSLNKGLNESIRTIDYFDLNGDGLPDRLDGEKLFLNTGYGFLNQALDVPKNLLSDKGGSGGLGLSLGFGDKELRSEFGGGIATGINLSDIKTTVVDMNGDGLGDRVELDKGKLKIEFNTGAGFTKKVAELSPPVKSLSLTEQDNQSVGGYFTISIPLPPPVAPMHVIINPGANTGAIFNRQTIALKDMNSDGLVDIVVAEGVSTDNSIFFGKKKINIYYNEFGNRGLLKQVYLPTHPLSVQDVADVSWESSPAAKYKDRPNIQYDFAKAGLNFKNPMNHWVLSEIITHDGVSQDEKFDANVRMRTCLSYSGGFYSRFERQFLGFNEIEKIEGCSLAHTDRHQFNEDFGSYAGQVIGVRKTSITYANKSIFEKGLVLEEKVFDLTDPVEGGLAHRETKNRYALLNIPLFQGQTEPDASWTYGCFNLNSVKTEDQFTHPETIPVVHQKTPLKQLTPKLNTILQLSCQGLDKAVTLEDGVEEKMNRWVRKSMRLTPILLETSKRNREALSKSLAIETRVNFEYDDLGRVRKITDHGNLEGNIQDDAVAEITYIDRNGYGTNILPFAGLNQKNYGLIKSILVSSNGDIVRKRTAEYFPNTGALAMQCEYLTDKDTVDLFSGSVIREFEGGTRIELNYGTCIQSSFEDDLPPTLTAENIRTIQQPISAKSLDLTKVAKHYYIYNDFGDLQKYGSPVNYKGDYSLKSFEYSSLIRHLPQVEITNICTKSGAESEDRDISKCLNDSGSHFGFFKSSEDDLDIRHGAFTTQFDINNNGFRIQRDGFGRPKFADSTWVPENEGKLSRMADFSYDLDGQIKSGVKKYIDAEPYETLGKPAPEFLLRNALHDQYGTIVQTYDSGSVCELNETGAALKDMGKCDLESDYSVSGIQKKDRIGRVVDLYFPPNPDLLLQPRPDLKNIDIIPSEDGAPKTELIFDGLDRPRNVNLADDNSYELFYIIKPDNADKTNRHFTIARDARCTPLQMSRDVRGNISAVYEFFNDTDKGNKRALGSSFKGEESERLSSWIGSVTKSEEQQSYECNPIGDYQNLRPILPSDQTKLKAFKAALQVEEKELQNAQLKLDSISRFRWIKRWTPGREVKKSNRIIRDTEKLIDSTLLSTPSFNRTTYSYDALNNLTAVNLPARNVAKPNNVSIDIRFDNFGRRTLVNDPDRGLRGYQYDLAGNVTCELSGAWVNKSSVDKIQESLQKSPAKCIASGEFSRAIKRDYLYTFLSKVDFGNSAYDGDRKQVSYSYGKAAANNNQAGRLIEKKDVSVKEVFSYNALGQPVRIVKELKQICTQNKRSCESFDEQIIGRLQVDADFDRWGLQVDKKLSGNFSALGQSLPPIGTPRPTIADFNYTYDLANRITSSEIIDGKISPIKLRPSGSDLPVRGDWKIVEWMKSEGDEFSRGDIIAKAVSANTETNLIATNSGVLQTTNVEPGVEFENLSELATITNIKTKVLKQRDFDHRGNLIRSELGNGALTRYVIDSRSNRVNSSRIKIGVEKATVDVAAVIPAEISGPGETLEIMSTNPDGTKADLTVGRFVKSGTLLFHIKTDKNHIIPIDAPHDGAIEKMNVVIGQTYPIDTSLLVFGDERPPIYFQNIAYKYDPGGNVLQFKNSPRYVDKRHNDNPECSQPIESEETIVPCRYENDNHPPSLSQDDVGSTETFFNKVRREHAWNWGLLVNGNENYYEYDELNRLDTATYDFGSYGRSDTTWVMDRDEFDFENDAAGKEIPLARIRIKDDLEHTDSHELKSMIRYKSSWFLNHGQASRVKTERALTTRIAYPDKPGASPYHARKPQKADGATLDIEYDTFGRQVKTKSSNLLTWDPDDNLRKTETPHKDSVTGKIIHSEIHYGYDANGKRISKSLPDFSPSPNSPNLKTEFYYPDSNLTVIRKRGQKPEFLFHAFAGNTHLASKWSGSDAMFTYHAALSNRNTTDVIFSANDNAATARIYQQVQYAAFGEILRQRQRVLQDEQFTEAEGIYSENVMGPQPVYRFNGKELDQLTGLTYFGARYFNTGSAQWLKPDPILNDYLSGGPNAGVFNPKNLASYSFGWGNPISYIDPDGKSVFHVYSTGIPKSPNVLDVIGAATGHHSGLIFLNEKSGNFGIYDPSGGFYATPEMNSAMKVSGKKDTLENLKKYLDFQGEFGETVNVMKLKVSEAEEKNIFMDAMDDHNPSGFQCASTCGSLLKTLDDFKSSGSTLTPRGLAHELRKHNMVEQEFVYDGKTGKLTE